MIRGGASRSRAPVLAALVACIAGACGIAVPPSPSPGGAEVTDVPVVPPSRADAVACVSINPVECAAVVARLLALLPPERGNPFAIQVRLSRCPEAAEACAESLADRQGIVVAEYADEGTPLEYSLGGTPATPAIEQLEGQGAGAWTDPIQPGSPEVEGSGPFTLEIGHCGLLHSVDFDASFWVLVGRADGDHPAMTGAETGSITLLGPAGARYLGGRQVTFDLVRFPGARRFHPCR